MHSFHNTINSFNTKEKDDESSIHKGGCDIYAIGITKSYDVLCEGVNSGK